MLLTVIVTEVIIVVFLSTVSMTQSPWAISQGGTFSRGFLPDALLGLQAKLDQDTSAG